MKIKDLPKIKYEKVELYWGDFHGVINAKTRECAATLWTLDRARKEKEYFKEYVGLDLDSAEIPRFRKGSGGKVCFLAKQAEDGILDIVVNAPKFNKIIFETAVAECIGT